MKCSDVQQLLPELLDGAPDASFQTAFDSHVRSCPDCSDLLSELKLIASQARELAEINEPAPRVWVNIAAQLRAEGLIREPETVPVRPILVHSAPRRHWSAWWLAPVAAAILAAGAYVINHKPAAPVAEQRPATNPIAPGTSQAPTATNGPAQAAAVDSLHTPAPAKNSTPNPAAQLEVADSIKPASGGKRQLAAPPSADDQQFLSVVSTLAPSSRATYENELQAVNADIRETQAYVNRNPADADARQHLMDAYQQKALLYQIALDRIQ